MKIPNQSFLHKFLPDNQLGGIEVAAMQAVAPIDLH